MPTELTLYCGPMFSGKTTRLLAALERYRYRGKSVAVFKPEIDTRYSKTEIVTHGGFRIEAKTVRTGEDLLCLVRGADADVVAVDELFMIPGGGAALVEIFRHKDANVLVASLDLSSSLQPFLEVSTLLPWATKVEKCASVCTECGADAYYSYRLSESDDEIWVGGSEAYTPRCSLHHPSFSR